MPRRPVAVQWEVADDARFGRVARRGLVLTSPRSGHSVHVDVSGLQPARWYWYRFRAEGAISPVGRTRTAPAPGASTGGLRFGLASCQSYPAGYFAAYGAMAADDLDLVLHVGDYIYEGGPSSNTIRSHDGDRRGYVRCSVDPTQLRADYVLLASSTTPGVTVPDPETPVERVDSFVVPDGGPVHPL